MTNGPVTAYCAPGRKITAALALMLQGEHADEIIEHNWLAGRDEIILVRHQEFELPPIQFGVTGWSDGRQQWWPG